MMFRLSLVTLSVLLFGGCMSPRKIVFIDQAAHAGSRSISQVRADGDMLRVTLTENSAPPWVAGVHAQVISGDVYLSTISISSVVDATEFAVDFSGPKFPRDWRQRLYWIEGDSISSPINPFIEHVREIRRNKVTLKE